MTAALRREHARFLAPAERTFGGAIVRSPDSQRAKTLKVEFCRRLRCAREQAGLTQSELAAAANTSRSNVLRWERPDESVSPSLVHLAIAPRDFVLPLLAWAARQHEHELLAQPSVDDTVSVETEARCACLDLLRALEAQANRDELVERAALRVANASRAVLAMRGGR